MAATKPPGPNPLGEIREMTRLKKRLRARRPDIVIVELDADLEDTPGSNAVAELMFREMDVQPGPMVWQRFTDGRLRYFAVCRSSPGLPRDCKFIAVEGKPTVVLHGADCNMTHAIDRDMKAGVDRPFEYCEKRLRGGVFELIEGRRIS
jgi:hypothetical protein